MPRLQLPISLKTHLTEFHQITHFLSYPQDNKLITAGINGDILIWAIRADQKQPQQQSKDNNFQMSGLLNDKRIQLQPIRYLTPCLSQTVGNLTCLQLINKPIMADLENIQASLLTIHRDNRVRIWDLQDGRCINISSHVTFESSLISLCVPLTPHANRFFVVGGKGKVVEIFDAWKMKSTVLLRLDDKTTSVKDIQILFDKKEIYVVDDQNILYVADVSDFFAEEASVYLVYVQNQSEFNRQIKQAKCKLLRKLKVTDSKAKLVQMSILQDIQFAVFVYPQKIIFAKQEEVTEEPISPEEKQRSENQSVAASMQASTVSTTPSIAQSTFGQSNAQMQLRNMIQRSQDLLQNGQIGQKKPAAIQLPVLKEKISFRLSLPKRIVEGSEEEKTFSFKEIQLISQNNKTYLLIFFQDGSCQIMCISDIQKLFEFNSITKEKDFTFDFASFSYSKRENSLKGRLHMQLVEVLQSLQVKQEYQDLQSSYSVLGFDPENNLILRFNQDNSELLAYDLNSHFQIIDKTLQQIKYLKLENEKIENEEDSKNLIEYAGLKIVLEESGIQDTIYKKKDLSAFLISKELAICKLSAGQTKLCDREKIFHPLFYVKYGAVLEEKYGQEIITVSSMDFIDEKSAYYFFGTTNGKVIGIPLLFSDDKQMVDILEYKFDTPKAITFLEYHKGKLVMSSSSGRTAVIQLVTPDEQLIKPDINFNDKLNIIDLSQLVKFKEIFAAPVKHLLKIRIVNSILKDPQYAEIIKEAEKYLQHTLAFVLANNSVVVYNSKTSVVDYFLNANKGSIYSVYFHPVADYFLILTSEGRVNIWSVGSKRYERTSTFEQNASLFDLEGLIQDNLSKVVKGKNTFPIFKEVNSSNVSRMHALLEFNQRYFDDTVNYTEEASSKESSGNLIYEQLGELRDQKHTIDQQLTLLWMIQIFSYIPFVYPWGDQVKKADLSISNLIQHKRPVFNYIVGCAGLGQCFSFSLEKDSAYTTSSYHSSMQALSIVLHLMNIGVFKNNTLTYNVMLDVANLFTKNKLRVHPNFKSLSLPFLARCCIDESNEVMSSASNLMINSLVYKDDENQKQTRLCAEMLSLNLKNQKDQDVSFSISEIKWLLMITYTNIFSNTQIGDMKEYIKRIVSGVEMKNCLSSPNLVAPCMKILTEGINLWKDMIDNYKELMANLIFIYFHYNTSEEQLEGLRDIPKPQFKKTAYLDLFLRQPDNIRKRMKLMTIKTIISLVGICQGEFLTLVNKEIMNFDKHPLYPCSIIDIIRNYIKVQPAAAQSRLPFFIEIILKSLDPNNPQQRKVCHTPGSKALLTIVQLFQSVSYHQQSQKVAVGTTQSQIFIYDLRTAVKWRVLAGYVGQVASLSFDNSGKHIAGFSTEDFGLRIWRVGSTGFFSSILNMNGTPSKVYQIPKNEYEALVRAGCKITILWDSSDKKIQINFGNENYRLAVSP